MRARTWFLLSLAALAALPGCGGEARDVTSSQLSALTAELSKLRADQAALAARLEAIERDRPRAQGSAAARPEAPATPAAPATSRPLDGDRPALDVVRLGPSDEASDEDTDADGPRTVLRSGSNGIIVEEQSGPAAAPAPAKGDAAAAKKSAPSIKKTDKTDRKKTASLPAP